MARNPFFMSAPQRRLGRRRTSVASSAPPALNQITGVTYGALPEELVVTVSGPLVGVGNLEELLSITIDENAYSPSDADLESLPTVVLSFGRDVSMATSWEVPVPSAWEFAEGELGEPFSGVIE